MEKAIDEIYLRKPEIKGNRIYLSWEPSYIFKENSYWVEYPDLGQISCSEQGLTEAYLPICLAFAALGNINVHLPWRLSDDSVSSIENIISNISKQCFRGEFNFVFINGDASGEISNPENAPKRTALLFGGGSESLLCLGKLFDRDISPYIISLGGPSWPGSDPNVNINKFAMDEMVASELNLALVRIRTNFRTIISEKDWLPYMKEGKLMLYSVLYLPFFLSLIFPICKQLGINNIVCGNEKESDNAFSYKMVQLFSKASFSANFEPDLYYLTKYDIVSSLHLGYPKLAKYQYSCWSNAGERWCCRCEKCFRNYILYKMIGVDPKKVQMEESKIKKSLFVLIMRASKQITKNKDSKYEWDNFSKKNKDFCVSYLLILIYGLASLMRFKNKLSIILKKRTPLLHRYLKSIRTKIKDICYE